jgi:hypothetical protein
MITTEFEKDCFWKYHGRSSYRRNLGAGTVGEFAAKTAIGLGANVCLTTRLPN